MKDFNLLIAASNLLLDKNLVWSDDFEQIRQELAKWLIFEAGSAYSLEREPALQALAIAEQLTGEEHELA
jgi:hypothetical protein